jgi:hypothetical protein
MNPYSTPLFPEGLPQEPALFLLPPPKSREEAENKEFEATIRPTGNRQDKKNNSHRGDRGTMIDRENFSPFSPRNARMLRRKATRLFPLHLAPIDAFFRTDDTLRYPMTSVIHLDFEGLMDRTAMEGALGEALERHPLLMAVIRPAKRGALCWVLDSGVQPRLDWDHAGKALTLPDGEQIRLDVECGLRIWVRVGDRTTRMTLQVHHACTDGTGIYRFLGDLLALYGRYTCQDEHPPTLETVDASLLRDRRRRMANIAVNAGSWRWIQAGLQEGGRVFLRNVQELAEPLGKGSSPHAMGSPLTPFPGIVTQELNKDEHFALREFAAAHGAMLNDLLMAEMFRAIAHWNLTHGTRHPKPWLRIMMPFDLREQSDYMMPAANMTSYTFVDRRTKDCSDREQLLRSIRDETVHLKQDRGGTRFIDALMLADKWPGLLPRMLRLGRCISSVTLSNIGDPTKRFVATFPRKAGKLVCGNLILNDISGVPPMRDRMRATCAVFSYQRKLAFSVRCDPFTFRAEDTQEFLQTYVDGLRSYVQ